MDYCECEHDAGNDDADYPDQEPIGFTLFHRTCEACGGKWEAGHCPHDGLQNPCPFCGWRPVGSRTPMESLGFARLPGEE